MENTVNITIEEMTTLQAMSLVGMEDKNLQLLGMCFGKDITFRDNTFTVKDCDEAIGEQIQDVIYALYELAKKNQSVSEQDVLYACRLVA